MGRRNIGKYDGTVIATPPEFHMDSFWEMCKEEGECPNGSILIEKPLALNMNSVNSGFTHEDNNWLADAIGSQPSWLMMAHNYLFDEALFEFKRRSISVLQSNRKWDYVSLDYMPDWHGVGFREGYRDRHEARDGCMSVSMPHAIYIMDYLFGLPDKERFYKMIHPSLETKGNTTVSGIRSNEGSMVTSVEDWSYKEQRIHQLIDVETRKVLFDWTKSDILGTYKKMMQCFLDVVGGAREVPELCRLSEGVRIVKAIESATYLENLYE